MSRLGRQMQLSDGARELVTACGPNPYIGVSIFSDGFTLSSVVGYKRIEYTNIQQNPPPIMKGPILILRLAGLRLQKGDRGL